MADHSPLPFHVEVTRYPMIAGVIVAENGDYVAKVVDHQNWRANAAYLVRACNSFDDLVAACRAVLDAKEYDGDIWVGRMYEAGEQIRAALAKAEGGDDA